jgi:hypothetical protein
MHTRHHHNKNHPVYLLCSVWDSSPAGRLNGHQASLGGESLLDKILSEHEGGEVEVAVPLMKPVEQGCACRIWEARSVM